MSTNSLTITLNDINTLCKHFKKNAYSVPTETSEAADALKKCKALLELDYNVVEIDNSGGVLCAHYPSKIFLCTNEIPCSTGSPTFKNEALGIESDTEVIQLRNQILKARKGRCRARFPVPVIFFQGKNICRSGTIAHCAEIYGRATVEAINSYISGTPEINFDEQGDDEQFNDDRNLNIETSVRNHDIQLLKMYCVDTIFDLMVEHRKLKYGMYVTSSENADAENRYSDFNIINIPYPGCEFFRYFYHNGKQGDAIVFDWEQRMVDKTLSPPSEDLFEDLNIEWKAYKSWDVITLTANYLSFVLRHLQKSKSGILIHCISGWDRTPLFISLVRMSLWADGLIHKKLTPTQMLYFTIAYDWMLFGHNLKNRLDKFEEIFFFCFYMLKHIVHRNCSIKRFYKKESPQVTPKKELYFGENGNFDFLDDEDLGKPIIDHREFETDINDLSENDNNDALDETLDFCGDTNIELSQENNDMTDLDSAELQSSPESNGNTLRGEKLHSNSPKTPKKTSPMPMMRKNLAKNTETPHGSWTVVTGSGSVNSNDGHSPLREHLSPRASVTSDSPKTPKKSSPMPMSRKDLEKDSDSLNGSWTIVTGTGSVHSNDGISPLRVSEIRFKRLNRIRMVFFKAFYHQSSVPYGPQSTFMRVFGHLAEKVGFA